MTQSKARLFGTLIFREGKTAGHEEEKVREQREAQKLSSSPSHRNYWNRPVLFCMLPPVLNMLPPQPGQFINSSEPIFIEKGLQGVRGLGECGTKEIKTEQKAELSERSDTLVLTHFYWNYTFPQKSSEGFRNIGCGSPGLWMLFLHYYAGENREKLAEEGRRGRAGAWVVDQHGFKSQSCHLGTCLGM